MSLQVKRAIANDGPGATTVVVSSVTGRVVRVVSVVLNCGTATNVFFLGSGTAVTPTWYVGSAGGFVLPHNEKGWCESVSGESITVTTSAGGTVGILVGFTHVIP